jgi:hypothetical protein
VTRASSSFEAHLDRTRASFSSNAAQTPDEAAATIIEALTAGVPPLRMQTVRPGAEFRVHEARRPRRIGRRRPHAAVIS